MHEILEEGWPVLSPLYLACNNTAAIDARGVSPIQTQLDLLAATDSLASILDLCGSWRYLGISTFVGIGVR